MDTRLLEVEDKGGIAGVLFLVGANWLAGLRTPLVDWLPLFTSFAFFVSVPSFAVAMAVDFGVDGLTTGTCWRLGLFFLELFLGGLPPPLLGLLFLGLALSGLFPPGLLLSGGRALRGLRFNLP